MIDQPPQPPLPPLNYSASGGMSGSLAGSLLLKGLRIDWGALSLVAQKASYTVKTKTLAAEDDVRVSLGPERIEGKALTLTGLDMLTRTLDKSGYSFRFSEAQLFSSVLYIQSDELTFSSETGAEARRLRFVPGPAPRGEIELAADRVRSQPGSGRLYFENATVRLLGNRLITLRRLTVTPRYNKQGPQQSLDIPILYRTSRVSGVAAGVRLPFSPIHGAQGVFLAESTSRQGTNTLITVRSQLLGQPTAPPTESLSLFGRFNNLTKKELSFQERLRPLLTAPLSPKDDLSNQRYATGLSAPATLEPLARQARPSLTLDAAVESNREFVRRDGVLLRSRLPEAKLTGRVPGRGGQGGWLATLSGGPAREKRLDDTGELIQSDRFVASLGWEAPRVPLGAQGQLHAFVGQTEQRYPHSHYSISELRLATDYGFTPQTGLAGGLALRRAQGQSPFRFDTLEANNEAQLRGQTQLGSMTISLLGRWDLQSGQLFDREVALGWRGKTVEPRLTWRSQSQQIGFTLKLPALTGF